MYKSNVNFNLYKTFYDVCCYGSISEAAKNTYVSQPAISKSIKKLESELNTKLFYRNINGMELTEKGKELFYYVEQAYNNLIIAERSVVESDSLDKGKLSIGVPSQIGTFYLFNNILKFHDEYPNIEISIVSKSTSELLKLLENHEIDFIIDSSPIITDNSNIEIVSLGYVDNCFAKNKSFDANIDNLKSLEKYPIVLPIKGANNRVNLDNYLNSNDISLNNVINIHTSEMIIGAIKANLGIGYILYDLVKDDKNLEIYRFNGLPQVEINLVYIDKYLTKVPKFFISKYIKNIKF